MNGKLVSIIIPVYNVQKYIDKCLNSIVNQSYKNLEIIIVNDGSLENEDNIVKGYMEYDSRIIYIKKDKNEGLFKARITGVESAHGDYIQFVDSDDYINQDFIRLLVENAEKEKSDITFANTVICTPKGSETVHIFQYMELYKLPLLGEDLKKAYYSQHGSAYIWHTIWNKLYKRELWEKALPHFKTMDEHIVMTEDIAFSSVLFYYADKAACSMNAVYFYCKHSDASTDSKCMSISQYKKQFGDVCKVFNFITDFFKEREEWIFKYIKEFRDYYGRIWRRIALNMSGDEKVEAVKISEILYTDSDKITYEIDDNYFCYMEVPYSKKLDEIKARIYEGKEKIISFDIFDTAINRPVYKPEDMFVLLDVIFEKYYSCNTSFYTIRTLAEAMCREELCSCKKEDVTLSEIYDYVTNIYNIPESISKEIMEYEKNLEYHYSNRRNSIYELYQLALSAGKKVVFISDMYLERETIEKILKKNGYTEYEFIFVSSEYSKLKKTSNLYRIAVDKLGIKSNEMLHIGDNEESDIKAAETIGIKTIYYPKALDAFCGKTRELTNKKRFMLGKISAGEYVGVKGFENNMSYGAVISMTANKFFDNPFIGLNDFTDFNVDSYFLGYYVLGANLIGQISWIEEQISTKNIDRILFTSRDGYLLMEAYKIYLEICKKKMNIDYFYVSRRSLMPWIVSQEIDLMNLPIVYNKYSPNDIEELLSFCDHRNNDEQWDIILQEKGLHKNKNFESLYEYQLFINLFLKFRYSKKMHMDAKKTIERYCEIVNDKDAIFDLGYSASIHKAICDASNSKPIALFMHTDEKKHIKNSRVGGFDVESMLDFIPNITGLIREFFFSDLRGSCVGYAVENNICIPVLETSDKDYSDLFPVKMMQDAALKLVSDFYTLFGNYSKYMEIRINEFIMPFEKFLSDPSPLDTKMFVSSYVEDKIYGKIEKINVRDFWANTLMEQPNYQKNNIDNFFDELIKKHKKKKLAFFGTGKMCEAIFEKNENINVDVFLDNNTSKSGKMYRGKQIFSPNDYKNLEDLYIVVVISFYKEVEEQLKELGLKKYKDFMNYIELF